MQFSRLPSSIKKPYVTQRWVELEYRGATVDVDVRGVKDIALYKLISRDKGKGHAKYMLMKLLSAAKKQGVRVVLWASPFGEGGLDRESLLSFYERLGFVFEDKEARHPYGVFNQ